MVLTLLIGSILTANMFNLEINSSFDTTPSSLLIHSHTHIYHFKSTKSAHLGHHRSLLITTALPPLLPHSMGFWWSGRTVSQIFQMTILNKYVTKQCWIIHHAIVIALSLILILFHIHPSNAQIKSTTKLSRIGYLILNSVQLAMLSKDFQYWHHIYYDFQSRVSKFSEPISKTTACLLARL